MRGIPSYIHKYIPTIDTYTRVRVTPPTIYSSGLYRIRRQAKGDSVVRGIPRRKASGVFGEDEKSRFELLSKCCSSQISISSSSELMYFVPPATRRSELSRVVSRKEERTEASERTQERCPSLALQTHKITSFALLYSSSLQPLLSFNSPSLLQHQHDLYSHTHMSLFFFRHLHMSRVTWRNRRHDSKKKENDHTAEKYHAYINDAVSKHMYMYMDTLKPGDIYAYTPTMSS